MTILCDEIKLIIYWVINKKILIKLLDKIN